MIIDEIKLKNVGVFLGLHSVELTPVSSEKNIILFGGMNGAGKTTLLESIQLGLFGRQAAHVSRSEGYEKHLRKSISRTVEASEGSSIEVSFRIKAGGKFIHHRLIRSWSEKRGKVSENLEVFVDGMFDTNLSNSWAEEVDRFLPPRLSPLFFFDGEKIESLANPVTSTKILETAIVSLLGVDLVDQLSGDLKILIARKSKEVISEANQQEAQVLEDTLNTVLQQQRELKDDKADLQTRLDHANLCFQRAELEYSEKGGGLFELANELKEEQTNTEALMLSNRMQLRQVAASARPLQMLKDEIVEIKVKAEAEVAAKKNAMLAKVHEQRDAEILRQLIGKECPAGVVKELSRFLDADRGALSEKGQCTVVYDFDETAMNLINQLSNNSLDSCVEATNTLLSDNKDIENRLNEIEKKLSRVPDEEQVRDAFIEMRENEKKVFQLQDRLLVLEEHLNDLVRKELTLTGALESVLGKVDVSLLQSEEQGRILEYSKKARSIMSDFKAKVIKRHAKRLEVLIASSFKVLLRKHNLIDSVKIDPHSCALSLYGLNGDEVLAEMLSAGERQLLATSILWALGKASGSNLPVVIDTPLGRLDSTHREHLLERYFPEASHQVILLSTDEEIDVDALGSMGNKVGRYYLLNFDDMTGGSVIQKGYFGGEFS